MSFSSLPLRGRFLSLAGGPALQATTPTAPAGGAGTPGTGFTPGVPTPTDLGAGSPTAAVPAAASSPTAVPTPANVDTPVATAQNIPQGQIANPFSMDYLTQAAQPGLSLFSGLFTLLSLIVLGGGIYLYFFRKNQWKRSNPLNFRLANFWGVTGMTLGGLGVLFVIFRLVQLDGLNARIWLYLMLLVMIGFAIYGIWYFRTQYAAALAKTPPRKVRPPTPSRTQTQAQRTGARPTSTTPPPARPAGEAGNPRGTSARGQRRRDKKR